MAFWRERFAAEGGMLFSKHYERFFIEAVRPRPLVLRGQARARRRVLAAGGRTTMSTSA